MTIDDEFYKKLLANWEKYKPNPDTGEILNSAIPHALLTAQTLIDAQLEIIERAKKMEAALELATPYLYKNWINNTPSGFPSAVVKQEGLLDPRDMTGEEQAFKQAEHSLKQWRGE